MTDRSIRILGRVWRIAFRPESEMDGAAGLCHTTSCLIEIVEGMSLVETLDTLIHEIMHALYYYFGLNPEAEEEENVVRRLSTGLTAVFLDNPDLTAFINQTRKENK